MSIREFLTGNVSSRVLVIGDVILDRYFMGDATRISPEAPVPVVSVREVRDVPGGAANTAMNLRGLGLEVDILGMVGVDGEGELLIGLLTERGFRPDYLFRDYRRTTVKIRVIARNQHVLRIDFEDTHPVDGERVREVMVRLRGPFDAVVISDYAKGLITPDVMDMVRGMGIPFFVDPKGRDWGRYRGAYLVTPNLRELSLAVGEEVSNTDGDVERWGRVALERFGLDRIVITRSEKGISFVSRDEVIHVPTTAQEVYDVSGAGDTVMAALVYGWLAGMDVRSTLELANLAAGIVIRRLGTHAITMEEILGEMDGE